ncbi:hypothetical protein AB447_208975 [Bacillus glycinifermentans]|uniref:Uncharacterized protein n=1 Tax=Bacillus glycinifermentans TaxID=1664069 RepID=A0A0T6BIF2_9BACI|nr:hypothetical protein AB447_208975 [Bacillus glycinifermentans]
MKGSEDKRNTPENAQNRFSGVLVSNGYFLRPDKNNNISEKSDSIILEVASPRTTRGFNKRKAPIDIMPTKAVTLTAPTALTHWATPFTILEVGVSYVKFR